jgi:hypothetical protein
MRVLSFIRIATLALSLTAALGATGNAFAATEDQGQKATNSGPYDSPNFVIPESNIFS